jgi:hypothetical protein
MRIPGLNDGMEYQHLEGDLLLYQLNAAIQGAAGIGIIRGDRGIGTVAIGLEAVGSHGILRSEDLHHGSGPALRLVEV